jgi:hypothetical protein
MMGTNGYCWPGFEYIAERTGVSVSTARRGVEELSGLGLIYIQEREGTSNRYFARVHPWMFHTINKRNIDKFRKSIVTSTRDPQKLQYEEEDGLVVDREHADLTKKHVASNLKTKETPHFEAMYPGLPPENDPYFGQSDAKSVKEESLKDFEERPEILREWGFAPNPRMMQKSSGGLGAYKSPDLKENDSFSVNEEGFSSHSTINKEEGLTPQCSNYKEVTFGDPQKVSPTPHSARPPSAARAGALEASGGSEWSDTPDWGASRVLAPVAAEQMGNVPEPPASERRPITHSRSEPPEETDMASIDNPPRKKKGASFLDKVEAPKEAPARRVAKPFDRDLLGLPAEVEISAYSAESLGRGKSVIHADTDMDAAARRIEERTTEVDRKLAKPYNPPDNPGCEPILDVLGCSSPKPEAVSEAVPDGAAAASTAPRTSSVPERKKDPAARPFSRSRQVPYNGPGTRSTYPKPSSQPKPRTEEVLKLEALWLEVFRASFGFSPGTQGGFSRLQDWGLNDLVRRATNGLEAVSENLRYYLTHWSEINERYYRGAMSTPSVDMFTKIYDRLSTDLMLDRHHRKVMEDYESRYKGSYGAVPKEALAEYRKAKLYFAEKVAKKKAG